jgi:sulfur relay (sulfurtransferase) complex TusBCD TusD component (DsrE family)
MEKQKLGVLLSTPPSHPHLNTVVRLCEEGLRGSVDVYLYLIDDGVRALRDERLASLSGAGLKLFVCAYGCQQHGVSTAQVQDNVQLCGLVVLSNILNGCDRFVAFN